jgi:predicted NUDIX family NTP pyrophosphohydrolase
MPKRSAGLLVYRLAKKHLQVLLVHPGGPLYTRKDAGVWSIPKGEYDETEDPLTVAVREFHEETGNTLHGEQYIELGAVKLKSGKIITAWAVEADFEHPFIRSNAFGMEWPPKSGKMQLFPEVDNAKWFPIDEAIEKIHPAQVKFIHQLASIINAPHG